jgi:DNA polymerase III alpha subunit
MTPIFKSTYSIGRSILTLEHPDDVRDDGADSIISIALDNKLDELFLVEDSMVGFFNAYKKCKEFGIQLVFGYRFTCYNELNSSNSDHKLIAFAKNDDGCKDLNRFYSHINTKCNGKITNDEMCSMWTDNMLLVVPFYDSFIFNNQLYLSNCIPNFKHIKPLFFLEKNSLPFDELIYNSVFEYTKTNNFDTHLTKSIYYRYKSDFEAFQTYKILCNRSFGRQATLSSPNLNHFGSEEFCWESYLEQCEQNS